MTVGRKETCNSLNIRDLEDDQKKEKRLYVEMTCPNETGAVELTVWCYVMQFNPSGANK